MPLSDPMPPLRRNTIQLKNAAEIEKLYTQACKSTDSINEHLPVIRKLASECDTIVEFGVKIARSSRALLLGVRGRLHSFDIVPTALAKKIQELAGPKWIYKICSSLKATIPKCDMLFIDSLHTYTQLKAELAVAAHQARRYLVLHDTVTFGQEDAIGETGKSKPNTPGIMPAVEELLKSDLTWKIKHHYENNNGLMVLERDLKTCVCVYTSIFGNNTDKLQDPEIVNPYCRYICFSDRPQNSSIWETWEVPMVHTSPIKQARHFKILGPNTYLSEYGFTLWADASYTITCDPIILGQRVFDDDIDITMFKHPDRNTIEAEAQAVIKQRGINPDQVSAQIARYRKEGFKDNQLSATGFLFRRNTVRTQRFNQIWWSELDRGIIRDQISVDYALWKVGIAGVNLKYLEGSILDNPFARLKI